MITIGSVVRKGNGAILIVKGLFGAWVIVEAWASGRLWFILHKNLRAA